VFELRAGELFYIPQVPHDSWWGGTCRMCPLTSWVQTTMRRSRRTSCYGGPGADRAHAWCGEPDLRRVSCQIPLM
jgi:hypothetical protein